MWCKRPGGPSRAVAAGLGRGTREVVGRRPHFFDADAALDTMMEFPFETFLEQLRAYIRREGFGPVESRGFGITVRVLGAVESRW